MVGLGRHSCPFGEFVQQRGKYQSQRHEYSRVPRAARARGGAGGALRIHQEGTGSVALRPRRGARVTIAGDAV